MRLQVFVESFVLMALASLVVVVLLTTPAGINLFGAERVLWAACVVCFAYFIAHWIQRTRELEDEWRMERLNPHVHASPRPRPRTPGLDRSECVSLLCVFILGVAALLHHASKAAGSAEEMSLENALRGTGDLGAMCDAVWALRYDRGPKKRFDESDVGLSGGGDTRYVKESRQLVRLQVACVKGRDFKEPDNFRVQLEPHIDLIGDLGVLADDEVSDREKKGRLDRLEEAIRKNPRGPLRELAQETHIGVNNIKGLAKKLGFEWDPKKGWFKPEPEPGDGF